jgi:ATP-dependent DNA helicase RecQ
MRFQLLILELLERGALELGGDWKLAIRCVESAYPYDLAVQDILLWLAPLLKLQKSPFGEPNVELRHIDEWEEASGVGGYIKVDFSLLDRYTDENVHDPGLIFVRSDYFEHNRLFQKSNSKDLRFVELRPYDYNEISTAKPLKYRLQFGGAESDEPALRFLAKNILLQKVESPSFNDGQLPIISPTPASTS